MQMEQGDIKSILDLLNKQAITIARMDERQQAMASELKNFREDVSEFREDVSGLKQGLQSVQETAFKNAVIVGCIGAGLGSVATIVARKLIGG